MVIKRWFLKKQRLLYCLSGFYLLQKDSASWNYGVRLLCVVLVSQLDSSSSARFYGRSVSNTITHVACAGAAVNILYRWAILHKSVIWQPIHSWFAMNRLPPGSLWNCSIYKIRTLSKTESIENLQCFLSLRNYGKFLFDDRHLSLSSLLKWSILLFLHSLRKRKLRSSKNSRILAPKLEPKSTGSQWQ
jgi:hypothetical protein